MHIIQLLDNQRERTEKWEMNKEKGLVLLEGKKGKTQSLLFHAQILIIGSGRYIFKVKDKEGKSK